jgi:hypothetical protein
MLAISTGVICCELERLGMGTGLWLKELVA